MNEDGFTEKEVRARRIADSKKKAKRQKRIIRDVHGGSEKAELYGPKRPEHFYETMHAFNCGNPNCVMCGNPRKFNKEKTIQERSFEQTEGWDE